MNKPAPHWGICVADEITFIAGIELTACQSDALPGRLPGVTAALCGQAETGAPDAVEDAYSEESEGQNTPAVRVAGSAARQSITDPGKDADPMAGAHCRHLANQ